MCCCPVNYGRIFFPSILTSVPWYAICTQRRLPPVFSLCRFFLAYHRGWHVYVGKVDIFNAWHTHRGLKVPWPPCNRFLRAVKRPLFLMIPPTSPLPRAYRFSRRSKTPAPALAAAMLAAVLPSASDTTTFTRAQNLLV